MRITPLEIRQKSFEKKMRGYDKDAVDAFILSVSHEWERLLDDQKHLKQQLETSLRDVSKLREVEESLFKTLKTAEDTGSSLVEQATKSAALTVKEAQMDAESMLAEARSQVKDMLDQAEEHVKEVLGGLDDEARRIEGDLRLAENQRDAVLRELSMLANDTLARVANLTTERVKVVIPKKEIVKLARPVESISKTPEVKKEQEIEEVNEAQGLATSESDDRNEISFEINTSFEESTLDENKKQDEKPKQGGSFFDQIDD
jgi:cell division initiation protein